MPTETTRPATHEQQDRERARAWLRARFSHVPAFVWEEHIESLVAEFAAVRAEADQILWGGILDRDPKATP